MSFTFAVVGAGGFACFSSAEFVKLPGVRLGGVLDANKVNAEKLRSLDETATIFNSLDELCADPSIDLVYIATPPYLHYEQSKAVLLAGKHVICEKPAAIELKHAQELELLAAENNLLFVVNLMQRYNPLYGQVREVIRQGLLGEFLHGYFENYASDEALREDHWFWDERKSGGIFIEHGVHFFDMFSGWLGQGRIVSAQKIRRPDITGVWDRVNATALYAGGVVNFYHGFDQPKKMDRQELRLLFELGEMTLFEWVPTRMILNGISDETKLSLLKEIFPHALIEINEVNDVPVLQRGRFKEVKHKCSYRIDTGSQTQKQDLYKTLVRSMFSDQLAWIRNGNHVRQVDQTNAVESLRLAVEAEQLSMKVDAR